MTWTNNSKGERSSRFAYFRVVPEKDLEQGRTETLWLVIERPDDEPKPQFFLSSLPRTTTRKELARLIHQRWRTERVYQDLKQEFGVDEYQGRSFVGWHHHVTAAMVCYAFAAAEQARLFPPPTCITKTDPPFACAA